MNREEKRRMQRQGQLGPDGTPATSAGAVQDRQRRVRQAGARQASSGNLFSRSAEFMRETRGELRKVAWPTRVEVRQYSTVVFATLVILITLIFVLDDAFSHAVLYLFHAS